MKIDLEPTGDCYKTAAEMVLTLPGHAQAVLVHGMPTLQRKPFIQYGHAWVEIGDLCFDTNVGAVLRRDEFYRLGSIDAAQCFKYSPREARMKMITYGHYGPWEGPEGCPPVVDKERYEDE